MITPNPRRTILAVIVAVLLMVTGGGSIWLVASSGALSGRDTGPDAPGGAAEGGTVAEAAALFAGEWFRLEQPRDPFAPLITSPAPVTSVTGSSTTGGGSTTTGTGGMTTSTTAGSTTTTTTSDHPTGPRISLLEIRTEAGVWVAVLTVDGVTYTQEVGDTFADGFKVISLSSDSGVFMYGENVFTLVVGQSIVK